MTTPGHVRGCEPLLCSPHLTRRRRESGFAMAVVPSVRTIGTRAAAVLSVVLVVGSLTASPASAATIVGSTFTPLNSCGAPYTGIQTFPPPGTSYTVGSAGVITSWPFQAAASPPTLKFKVFRPTAGINRYTVVGSSATVAPIANTLNTYHIRIPVLPGDIIGETTVTAGFCGTTGGGTLAVAGDVPLGTTSEYFAGSCIYTSPVCSRRTPTGRIRRREPDSCLTQATAALPATSPRRTPSSPPAGSIPAPASEVRVHVVRGRSTFCASSRAPRRAPRTTAHAPRLPCSSVSSRQAQVLRARHRCVRQRRSFARQAEAPGARPIRCPQVEVQHSTPLTRHDLA